LAGETIFAVDRAVAAGLERHLGAFAATGAGYRMHFALSSEIVALADATAVLFAGCTAARATPRIIGKSLFRKKFLFGNSENKLGAAVFTV